MHLHDNSLSGPTNLPPPTIERSHRYHFDGSNISQRKEGCANTDPRRTNDSDPRNDADSPPQRY
jgi:hypothetical protein